jgi:hypothetical protein
MSGRTDPPMESPPEKPMLAGDLRSFDGARLTMGQRRNRLLAGAVTVGAHIAIFTALFWPHAQPPRPPELPAIEVSLLDTPKPTPPAPPEPVMIQPGSTQIALVPLPPIKSTTARAVAQAPAPDNSDLLSASQLAGATAIGEGGGGGGTCDMAHAVQQALRRDPLVRTAVEGAHRIGMSVMLWNGDWVRTGEEEGKGLSAVREAISWEVAFAPEACRNMRMHGLLLLSLADGSTRFAVGADSWRWSDLLGLRAVPSNQ